MTLADAEEVIKAIDSFRRVIVHGENILAAHRATLASFQDREREAREVVARANGENVVQVRFGR